jgi:hypothetical protein
MFMASYIPHYVCTYLHTLITYVYIGFDGQSWSYLHMITYVGTYLIFQI